MKNFTKFIGSGRDWDSHDRGSGGIAKGSVRVDNISRREHELEK